MFIYYHKNTWRLSYALCTGGHKPNDIPLDSKLNSAQDGVNRLSLACTHLAVTPGEKVMKHPVELASLIPNM